MAKKRTHHCKICDKSFFTPPTCFRNHLRTHSGIKPYHCEFPSCNKSFAIKNYLRIHSKLHNSDEKRFNCQFCLKRFHSKGNYEVHLETHSLNREKNVKCETCGAGFYSKYHLNKHIKFVHEKDTVPLKKCLFCPNAFPTNTVLLRHLSQHTKEKPYFCKSCPAAFGCKKSLQSHMSSSCPAVTMGRPLKCSKCSQRFQNKTEHTKHYLETHVTNQRVKCPICEKSLRSPEKLKVHLDTIHGSPRFSCPTCGKRFAKQSYLKQHERRHFAENRLQCKICDKTFKYKYTLDKHLRNQHSNTENQELFSCVFCKTACKTMERYKGHLKTHIRERPHFCNICPEEFLSSESLKSHMELHAAVFGQVFPCGSCGKGFLSEERLKRHEKAHFAPKRFHCEFCDYRTHLQERLYSHMRTHLQEKPFRCSYSCGKTFSLRSSQGNHERGRNCIK